MSVKLDPQYGKKLTIGNELISDEAIVTVNGTNAIAYVWNEKTGSNEIVGRLRDVTMEAEKRGSIEGHHVLTGIDAETGEAETWKLAPGRPCSSC